VTADIIILHQNMKMSGSAIFDDELWCQKSTSKRELKVEAGD